MRLALILAMLLSGCATTGGRIIVGDGEVAAPYGYTQMCERDPKAPGCSGSGK